MEDINSQQEADAVNDGMVQAMDRRRRARPERRRAVAATPRIERRKVCTYCFQPGDHLTAASCRRALER